MAVLDTERVLADHHQVLDNALAEEVETSRVTSGPMWISFLEKW